MKNHRKNVKLLLFTALGLLCCALLTGAAQAPVFVTNSFYINDYANCLSTVDRDAMLLTAGELYEKTGVQLVILTVDSTDGSPTYGKRVFDGWGVGGAEGKGILLLLVKGEKHASYVAGAEISEAGPLRERLGYILEQINNELAGGNYGRGLYNGFFSMADELFFQYGAARESQRPESQTRSFGGPAQFGIIAVLGMLILLRGWQVFMKNRKKKPKADPYAVRTNPRRVRQLVYNREKGEYEERSTLYEEPDDLPSGFGGAVSIKEHIYDEDAMPLLREAEVTEPPPPAIRDYWESTWEESDDSRR